MTDMIDLGVSLIVFASLLAIGVSISVMVSSVVMSRRRVRTDRPLSHTDYVRWLDWFDRVMTINTLYAMPTGCRLFPLSTQTGTYDLCLYEPSRGSTAITWRTIKPEEADRNLAKAIGRLLAPIDEAP